MNVGIVTTWFERGAAYVSRAYMEALKDKCDVFIYARGGEFTAKGDPLWDASNVTWGKRFKNTTTTKVCCDHFYKWLLDNKIKVIIFNEQKNLEVVEMASRLGVIVGSYVDYYKKDTVKYFNIYDFLLCNTKRHYGVFKNHKNSYFIQWGTDTEVFNTKEQKSLGKEVVFFHSAGMGGIGLRKGTDLLVSSFAQVKGGAKLIIHSQVPIENYGQTADEIKADYRIEFIHKTVPAPGFYHMGDVYVYPSKLDGVGLSVPEALACGLPVITTDVPPMNEFVGHNYNGLLTEVDFFKEREDNYYWPESYVCRDHLTKNMQFYVDRRDVLVEHQRNARASAVSRFDWKKNSKCLYNYLSKYEEEENIKFKYSVYFFLKFKMLCELFIEKYVYLKDRCSSKLKFLKSMRFM